MSQQTISKKVVEQQINRVDVAFESELAGVKGAGGRENSWGFDFLRGMLHLSEADTLGRFLANREKQVESFGREYLRLETEPESEARTRAMNQAISRWQRAKDEVEAVKFAYDIRVKAAETVTGKKYQSPKERMEAANLTKERTQSDVEKLRKEMMKSLSD